MRWATVWRLGVKELWSLWRTPALLVLIALVFTVQIVAASVASPLSLNQAAIAVVDEDRSPLAQRLATAFYPPGFLPPHQTTLSELNRRLDEGYDTFGLVIPAGFQRDLLAGEVPELLLLVDATRMTQAFNGAGYVQAIVSDEIQNFLHGHLSRPAPPVELVLRARFNQELDPSWFAAMMEVVNSVALLSVILAGAALIRERERGTIEHLLVMPVTPTEIMLAKIWPTGLVVLLAAMFSLIFVVQTWLSIPVAGSLWLLMGGMTLLLFATTSLGIFLATLAGTMPQFGLLLMLVLFPLQILSGGVTPTENMPKVLNYLMQLAPDTHFVAISQAILFRGADFSMLWQHYVALAIIGLALFSFSLWRFRRWLR